MNIELDRIYNMDCMEGMKLIPDCSIDCVITSPPYDNMRKYGGIGDEWSFEKFKPIAKEIARVLKVGGVCVWIVGDATIDGSETGTSFRQALYFKDECCLNLHDTMIWEKISPFTHNSRYIPNFEYMFVFSKGTPKTHTLIKDRKNKWAGTKVHGTLRQDMENLTEKHNKGKEIAEYGARLNTWNIPAEKNNKTGHSAVFPERLVIDHLRTWAEKGNIVLDPFMGSGTTAVACIKEKRHFIGFELSKEYYDKAVKRIKAEQAQLTLF